MNTEQTTTRERMCKEIEKVASDSIIALATRKRRLHNQLESKRERLLAELDEFDRAAGNTPAPQTVYQRADRLHEQLRDVRALQHNAFGLGKAGAASMGRLVRQEERLMAQLRKGEERF